MKGRVSFALMLGALAGATTLEREPAVADGEAAAAPWAPPSLPLPPPAMNGDGAVVDGISLPGTVTERSGRAPGRLAAWILARKYDLVVLAAVVTPVAI